ncbi:deoxynucleoside kinase-like [Asterias rubens]|uniref:deoxynucleoside kinase-like n=1 Tax=Asterias rubens TaxID=7604 RepID=UPI001455D2EB|nr:deoxynucleoside kinase-like [Asterias rubens]XP_033642185.1 deoxynucleoside kinase-like [Asterias rubens]XP_033642186.1 deoxynucleoside kinase-like [Asterias rubens]
MLLSRIFRVVARSASNHSICLNRTLSKQWYNVLCLLSKHLNFVKMMSDNASSRNFKFQDGEKPFTVSIEGNIGAGKTTLVNFFSKQKDVTVIEEPVKKWQNVRGHNLFDLMYHDPQQWSFVFQSYVQLTMLENHSIQVDTPIKLMERSVHSARYCFVENMHLEKKMSDPEFVVLDELYQWVVRNHDFSVDRIIYLQTTPEKCHERVLERCRDEEEGIPLEYLQGIHQRYEDWLIHKKFPVPGSVMVLDATSSLEEMLRTYETKQNTILC